MKGLLHYWIVYVYCLLYYLVAGNWVFVVDRDDTRCIDDFQNETFSVVSENQ